MHGAHARSSNLSVATHAGDEMSADIATGGNAAGHG
jgi:hypothetical protein